MTAAEILIRSDVAALPVDIMRIAASYNIKVVSYESCAEIYDMDVQRMYSEISPQGFSFCDGGERVAAVNQNACGKQRRLWTTAHEMAHILLGHVTGAVIKYDDSFEREADRLAAQLLAPLEVLHFCGVSSAAEVARLCGLSKQAAEIRFRELQELRRRNSALARRGETLFLRSGEQKLLFEQFLPFITEYITRRTSHDGYEAYLNRISGHTMLVE